MALDYEQLLITNELSDIIQSHNKALAGLRNYVESHPYLLAPNLARMMEDNLKENVQMLYKELNNLHKPKSEQRRHVCRSCHGVFAVALPGGLCDECRSKTFARPAYPAATPRPYRPDASDEQTLVVAAAPADEEGAEDEIVAVAEDRSPNDTESGAE